MFKIMVRTNGNEWQHWMTVARVLDVVNERRRMLSQKYDVQVLDGNDQVISTVKA